MRNISFAETKAQMYAETKDVTRRVKWLTLKVGEVLCAVEKCQGLKKGEKIVRIYYILVLSVTREPLNAITKEECIREGFPFMEPEEFVEMFCKINKNQNVKPDTIITRIEFVKANEIYTNLTLF